MRLEVWKIIREQHARKLASCEQDYRFWIQKRSEQEQQLETLNNYYHEYKTRITEHLHQGVMQDIFLRYQGFLEQLDSLIHDQKQKIEGAQKKEQLVKEQWQKAYLKEQTLKEKMAMEEKEQRLAKELLLEKRELTGAFQRKYAKLGVAGLGQRGGEHGSCRRSIE